MDFSAIILELQETIILFVDYLLQILGIIGEDDSVANSGT